MLVVAFLIGALVGGCELIGRYKDSPFAALTNRAALGYILVNALAALAAYSLIVAMGWDFGSTGPAVPLVQLSVGSFGAMAFFRSSLFTVKVGTTDVAVGPAIFFQIMLFATDRQVDRDRGETRSLDVTLIMADVSFQLAQESLPNFCFELMQNVPVTEQQQFRLVVDALAAKTKMNDSVKALMLGLMLMNVVGKGVLKSAVDRLGELIKGPKAFPNPVALKAGTLRQLAQVNFAKAYPTLVDICFTIAQFEAGEEQAKCQVDVMREGLKFDRDPNLDNATKVLMLAISLQKRVGEAVLSTALAQLGSSLYGMATELPKSVTPANDLAADNTPPAPADELPSDGGEPQGGGQQETSRPGVSAERAAE